MKKRTITLWLALIALIPAVGLAEQGPGRVKADPSFLVGKLDNGLTYYIKKNANPKNLADFFIIQDVGAILENDDQNGLAHFLEHMAFNGTKNFPDKLLLDYFQSVGVKFGANINAYTAKDETVYYLAEVPTVRQSILDSALLVLHDWSSFITLDNKEIDDERGVIREEWRTRNGDRARLQKQTDLVLFKNSKYAYRDVIGDTAVINNFSYQTLKDYYHKWYRPDLQAIVVVGDIEPKAIEALVKKTFADVPKPVNPAPRPVFEVPDNEETLYSTASDPEAKGCNIRLYFKRNPYPVENKNSEEYLKLKTIYDIIENAFNNRFAEIQKGLDAEILSGKARIGSLVPSKDMFFVGVSTKNNGMEAGYRRMLTEIKRLKDHGFNAPEIDAVKKVILRYYESVYTERTNRKNDALVSQARNNFLKGEPIIDLEYQCAWIKNNLSKITPEEVNKVASGLITDNNRVVIATGPERESVKIISVDSLKAIAAEVKDMDTEPYVYTLVDKPLMAKLPAKGSIKKEFTEPEFGATEWILSNGVKVILRPDSLRKDQVIFSGYSAGGTSRAALKDLPSAYYAASFIQTSGVANHTSSELKQMLSGAKVAVQPEISEFYQGVSGYSSNKDLEKMFQLINLYIAKPRIDMDLCRAGVQKKKASFENKKNTSGNIFSDTINQVLFNRSPYRYHENGRLLDAIDPAKSFEFYKQGFASMENFTFVFTGNIDIKAIRPLVETYIASLPNSKKKNTWVDNGKRLADHNEKVHFASSMPTDKTAVYIAYTCNNTYTPETKVALAALSYDLRMRFMATLREQEGGTYGVMVKENLLCEPTPQSFIAIRFDTDPKIANKMVALVYKEIDNLFKSGVSDENLKRIKESFLKNYKTDNQNPLYWHNLLSTYALRGVNLDKDYKNIVENLTSEKIVEAAKVALQKGNCVEIMMKPQE